jgi:hypothetical protein
LWRRRTAAAREQLALLGRLDEVVVAAVGQRAHDVVLAVARGQEHDRQAAVGRGTDRFDDLDAGAVGQHPVEQQQVDGFAALAAPVLGGAAVAMHREAGAFEPCGDQIGNVRIVLEQADHHGRTVHCELAGGCTAALSRR